MPVKQTTPMAPERGTAEISSVCPDCGQVLVRPADFSVERLLYLHHKWGGCEPVARGVGPVRVAPESNPDPADRSAAG